MTFLSFITPTNIAAEKDTFFGSSTYNPQFEYNWEQPRIDQFISDKPHTAEFINTLLTQDNNKITLIAQQKFDTTIYSDILATAKDITSILPNKKHHQDLHTLVSEFKKALTAFDINYQIVVSNRRGFNIRPQHTRQRLVISKHLQLEYFSVESEVRHEVVHLIRAVNGTSNNTPKSDGYLPTEEGLASYCMDFTDPDDTGSLFQHAAEYVATQVGLDGSFRDIFNYFRSIGFSPLLAWQRGIRHKFGFKDTSKPGDIMKPAMYFHHEMKIKQLTNSERLRLFSAKINIADLPQFPEYNGQVSIEKIKSYYKLY